MLWKVDFGAIKHITDYATHRTVVEGCRVAAEELKCSLIEVEQLAGLGLGPGEKPPGKLVSVASLASYPWRSSSVAPPRTSGPWCASCAART